MEHASPLPGPGRRSFSLLAQPLPAGSRPRARRADVTPEAEQPSEGAARVFLGRAITGLGTLGLGTPGARELLRLMLHFLPAQALVSGRPWLPMGAAKLARLAGITERTLARRVAELRALGLLDRHLDGWNHPARAEDGSRCGYDLAPLVARAAELNAVIDRLFEEDTLARRRARRSASWEAARQRQAVAQEAASDLASSQTEQTGGADVHVSPIQTTNPDPRGSSVNSLGEGAAGEGNTHQTAQTDFHTSSGGASQIAAANTARPGPRRAARLLSTLSPDFAMLLRGIAGDAARPTEGELLAAADHLAQHLGVPRTAWAAVAPGHDRLSLAAVVVLGQAQDAAAFRTSRVAWVSAMLRRPGVDPWPSVHRALAQRAQGIAARPNRFLH